MKTSDRDRFHEPVSLVLAIKHADQESHFARERVRIELETSTVTSTTVTRATAAGDQVKLRGIPAIGRGVSGHIPGTRP